VDGCRHLLNGRRTSADHDERKQPGPLRLRDEGAGGPLEAFQKAVADVAGVAQLFQEEDVVLLEKEAVRTRTHKRRRNEERGRGAKIGDIFKWSRGLLKISFITRELNLRKSFKASRRVGLCMHSRSWAFFPFSLAKNVKQMIKNTEYLTNAGHTEGVVLSTRRDDQIVVRKVVIGTLEHLATP